MNPETLNISLWLLDRKDQPGPITVSESLHWHDLKEMIKTMYEEKPDDVEVKVIDDEDDLIHVDSQIEWLEEIKLARQCGNLVRMYAKVPKAPEREKTPETKETPDRKKTAERKEAPKRKETPERQEAPERKEVCPLIKLTQAAEIPENREAKPVEPQPKESCPLMEAAQALKRAHMRYVETKPVAPPRPPPRGQSQGQGTTHASDEKVGQQECLPRKRFLSPPPVQTQPKPLAKKPVEAEEVTEKSPEVHQNLDILATVAQSTTERAFKEAVSALRDAESGEKATRVDVSPDFFGFVSPKSKESKVEMTLAEHLEEFDRLVRQRTRRRKAAAAPEGSEDVTLADKDPVIHDRIRCDVCKEVICGVRYMCGNCANYDLCEQCERDPDVHNRNHVFLKLRQPCFNAGVRDGRKVPLLKRVIYEEEVVERRVGRNARLREEMRAKLDRIHRHAEEKAERKAAKLAEKLRRAEEKIERERRTEEKLKRKLERMELQRDLPQKKEKVELAMKKSFHDAELIRNVTIPDNTLVQPGTRLKKTWRMKNTGTKRWKLSTQLRMMFGDMQGDKTEFAVPFLKPQEEGDVTADIVAPRDPGRYMCQFKLNDKGTNFGPRLTCLVEVEPRQLLEPVAAKERLKVVEEENGEEEKVVPILVPAIAPTPELEEPEQKEPQAKEEVKQDIVEEVWQQMTRQLALGCPRGEAATVKLPKKSQTTTPNNTPLDVTPPKSPAPETVDLCEDGSPASSVEVVSEDGTPECDLYANLSPQAESIDFLQDYNDDILSLSSCSDSEDGFVIVLPDCFDMSKPISSLTADAIECSSQFQEPEIQVVEEPEDEEVEVVDGPGCSLPVMVSLPSSLASSPPTSPSPTPPPRGSSLEPSLPDGPAQASADATVLEVEDTAVAAPLESCAQAAPSSSPATPPPQENTEAAPSQSDDVAPDVAANVDIAIDIAVDIAQNPVAPTREMEGAAAAADQSAAEREAEVKASDGSAEHPRPAPPRPQAEAPRNGARPKAQQQPGEGADELPPLFFNLEQTNQMLKTALASAAGAANRAYSTWRGVFSTLQGRADQPQNSDNQPWVPPNTNWVPPKSEWTPPKSEWTPPKSEWTPPKSEWTPPKSEWTPPKEEWTPPKEEFVPPATSSAWTPEPVTAMDRLVTMGFGNRAQNQRLLDKHNNDLQRVIEELVETLEGDWSAHRH